MNNKLSEDYSKMPKAIQRKTEGVSYARERYLAKEYIKHLKLKEKENKQKLKVENVIRLYIRKLLKEEIKNVSR